MSKIDESTLAILSRTTVEGNEVFLNCGQLNRKQYLAVNKVLEDIGGKWDRKSRSHIFAENPTEKLESVLLTGESVSLKEEHGLFPTPVNIAKRLIKEAEIEPGTSVLEPSAGQGGIADYLPEGCEVSCIELLADNVAILERKGYRVQRRDFLAMEPGPLYDRVVMNPPFERQQDISHVSHAWKFLLPGGRLVAIVSAGVLFRENRKTVEFRELIKTFGYVERLPQGSFETSGTGVNTCIVVLKKPDGIGEE